MSIIDFVPAASALSSVPRSKADRQPQKRPAFVSTQVSEARRYFLDLRPDRTRDITVVCGGCERVRSDYEVRRQTFPYFAIEFVAEGEGTLTLDGKDWRLRPGSVFAYGPKVPHLIRTEPARPMLKYYVDFVGERARRLLERSPIQPGECAQVFTPGELRGIFELLQQNATAEPPFAGLLCAALVPVLIVKIGEQAVAGSDANPRALATFQRAKRYLEEHAASLKTLEEAARGSGVNLSYLCRLFQRFDRQTPYRFLLRMKMNRAAQLLLDDGLLVKEAAAALDFPDAFSFSRTFKLIFGLSPAAFLRQSRR
jgi:AraC-like DNA-binding protein